MTTQIDQVELLDLALSIAKRAGDLLVHHGISQ